MSDGHDGYYFKSFATSKYRFAPKNELEGKENASRHCFIDRTGEVHEVVRLNILHDRDREEVIAYHFSRQYAEIHYRESTAQPQFYMIGRDCPWDFEYVMHDGNSFYLEICRVAQTDLLKAMKIENDCLLLCNKERLTGYELLKLKKHFPDSVPDEVISKIVSKVDKLRLYSNKIADFQSSVFLRPPLDPFLDLKAAIETAVSKKSKKRHNGKDQTILLLDNITTHSSPSDFAEAFGELESLIIDTPFKEIWLYTGYYSDLECTDFEYSLMPVKLDPKSHAIMFDGS